MDPILPLTVRPVARCRTVIHMNRCPDRNNLPTPASTSKSAANSPLVFSIRRECLDHFVFFGEKHLRHVLSEYIAYFNEQRPNQAMGNRPLGQTKDPEPVETLRIDKIACDERLGGLLKHYRHAA